MEHEEAKKRLAEAREPSEQREAIRFALAQGMSLREIEEFLDWLDRQSNERSR